MAKKKTEQEKIELKYGRLVSKCYKQYKTRSWGEFMAALDEIKRQMAKEMEDAGLLEVADENQSDIVDTEDESGDAR